MIGYTGFLLAVPLGELEWAQEFGEPIASELGVQWTLLPVLYGVM